MRSVYGKANIHGEDIPTSATVLGIAFWLVVVAVAVWAVVRGALWVF
jgi:hypothetical protein